MAGSLMVFGAKIATLSGKPSKVSAGKRSEPGGKITVHVPGTVGTIDDAIDVCKAYKGSVKMTQSSQDGFATINNTVNLNGENAALAIAQLRDFGTDRPTE